MWPDEDGGQGERRPVALVTGARKGLGKYISERLVDAGFSVVGCSREAVDWTMEGYTHLLCDVSDEGQVKQLIKQIGTQFGHLDVTINNAGVASMNHVLLTPVQSVRRVLDTNVVGTFLVSREAAKLMRHGKTGRIINLSSIAAPLDLEGEAIYAASKSAVESLTRVMSRELASLGITVNAIGPTPIDTDLLRGIPPERIVALVERMAIKRLGTLEDLWNVVRFFINPDSSFITGQVIYLGGVS